MTTPLAQITWIVLPNGVTNVVTNGVLHFTVAVSPQLQSTADVDALGVWPHTVKTLSPALLIDGTPIAATLDTSPLNENLWSALFPSGKTPVKPYALDDLSKKQLHSFNARLLSGHVHDAYTELTTQGTTHPVLSKLLASGATLQIADFLAEASQAASFASGLYAPGSPPIVTSQVNQTAPTVMRSIFPKQYAPRLLALKDVGSELVNASAYFNRNNLRTFGVVSKTAPPPPSLPVLDFHEVIARLSDQPEVLRALGLVLDFTITMDKVAGFKGTGKLVQFSPGPSVRRAVRPITICTLVSTSSMSAFYAEPANPAGDLVPGGMMTIGDTKTYTIDQLDIDAAVTSITEAAVHAVPNPSAPLPDDPVAVPSLRSNGFSILKDNRDGHLSDRISNAAGLAKTPDSAKLQADDLVRGYRLDVSTDGGATWKSLHQRVGTVSVTGTGGTFAVNVTGGAPWGRDEGYVKASAVTTPSDPSAADVYHVHHALCGWSGWSLSVRRPGKAAGGGDSQTAQAIDIPNKPATSTDPFQVTQQFHVPQGSLPKLRFGQSYSFRLRTVDLAGNSLPLTTTMSSVAATLSGTAYASAVPLLTAPSHVSYRYEPIISPTLVYRRPITEGESLERLVIRSDTDAADGAGAYAARLNALSGKTIYQATSERHVAPPKTSQTMAERHGAFDAIIAKHDAQTAFRVACKERGSYLESMMVDTTNLQSAGIPSNVSLYSPNGGIDSDPKLARGTTLDHGEYVFYDMPQAPLPYLPDPLAIGASFKSAVMDPPQQYVAAQPTFVIPDTFETAKPFRFILADAGLHTTSATVSIDAATSDTTIAVPPGTMLTLDYRSTIPLTAGPQLVWCAVGKAGIAHFLVAPKRQVTLVHATPKPVNAPSLVPTTAVHTFGPSRVLGATYTHFTGSVTAHSPSTASVELEATWTEWDDATCTWVPHTAKPITLAFAYGDGPRSLVDKNIRHEFGDTKARTITYTPIGTTRYREYFPPAIISDSTNITRRGVGQTVTVPASAVPPPPKVLYVVPSYKWTPAQAPNALTRARAGGALRIYFDRPWFVSGVDERVAVICQPATPPNPDSQFVSVLGLDPLYMTFGDADEDGWLPKVTDFPVDGTRITAVQNYFLPNGAPVDAVTFPVEFAADRKLFYIDVEMPAGAGQMASFVLARYQPHHISSGLSTTVRTDFTLIANDRSTAVTRNSDTGFTCTVAGTWLTNAYVPPAFPPIPDATAGSLPNAATPTLTVPPKVKITNQAPYVTSGRYVEVALESNTGPAPTSPDDLENELGWTPVFPPPVPPPPPPAMPMRPQPIVVKLTPQSLNWTGTPETVNDGPVVFRGIVPAFTRTPGARYRLVVREWEVRQTDSDVANIGNGPVVIDKASVPLRNVLVYSDVFNVV